MFIEKLNEEDFVWFVTNCLNLNVNEMKYFTSCIGTNKVRMYYIGNNGQAELFEFEDFSLNCDCVYYSKQGLSYVWQGYMKEKFGDKYKNAFNENLKQSEMIK